nr:hypothetical protein [Microbacterium testaceum]
MSADRDAVQDDDVRTDPYVVVDDDAFRGERLLEDRDSRFHRVVEAEDGRVRPDTHTRSQANTSANDGVRVDAAIATGDQFTRQVGARCDVGPFTEVQHVVVGGGRVRDEGISAERAIAPFGEVEQARPLRLLRFVGG